MPGRCIRISLLIARDIQKRYSLIDEGSYRRY